jgi:hypothetical protein
MTNGCVICLTLSMAIAAAVPLWLHFHWRKTVTQEEADNPPADPETRMRRAKNLGAEADHLANRYRFYEERRYWGQKDYHKRPRQRAESEIMRQTMDAFDREFGT